MISIYTRNRFKEPGCFLPQLLNCEYFGELALYIKNVLLLVLMHFVSKQGAKVILSGILELMHSSGNIKHKTNFLKILFGGN